MGIWYVFSMRMFLIIEEDKSLFHMFVFLLPLWTGDFAYFSVGLLVFSLLIWLEDT